MKQEDLSSIHKELVEHIMLNQSDMIDQQTGEVITHQPVKSKTKKDSTNLQELYLNQNL